VVRKGCEPPGPGSASRESYSVPPLAFLPMRTGIVGSALVLLAACGWDAPPLVWDASEVRPAPRDSAGGDSLTATAVGVATSPAVPSDLPPTAAAACPGSVVRTRALGRRWAAWWQVRQDSSAVLMLAQRPDSVAAWTTPLAVDTLDRASLGCARPAPALAADSLNGYVHVVYYMQAVEGPGVFYAHVMDPRQQTVEVPQAMVYGELPSRVSVASRGDTVAIAYEDPNSARGRIAMHLSLSAGHLFEQTSRLIPVSSGNAPARIPAVEVGAGLVRVSWRESSPAGASLLRRSARIVSTDGR
jgi:hypothetical protein